MVERSLHMPEFILIDNFFFFLLKWFPEYWKEFQAMYWYEMYLSDCHVSVFLFKKIFLKFHFKKNIANIRCLAISCNSFLFKRKKEKKIQYSDMNIKCVFLRQYELSIGQSNIYIPETDWIIELNIEFWILLFFLFLLIRFRFLFSYCFNFFFFFIFARECIYFGLWQKINKNFFYDP